MAARRGFFESAVTGNYLSQEERAAEKAWPRTGEVQDPRRDGGRGRGPYGPRHTDDVSGLRRSRQDIVLTFCGQVFYCYHPVT